MNYNPSYDISILSNHFDPPANFAENGIVFDIAQPHHREGVLEVLTRAFVHEPTTAAQTIGRPSYDHWRRFTEFYMEECLTNGLSTVALDAGDATSVVGAVITRDFLLPPDERCIDFVEQTTAFGPIVEVLDIIDGAWFDKHPELQPNQPGRVADLWMGGVRDDRRGSGIARQLVRMSLEQVTLAGFEYAIAECTGAFSQRLVENAGFTSVSELGYADFFWNGEAVFANVPAPHTKWVIYEKNLNQQGIS